MTVGELFPFLVPKLVLCKMDVIILAPFRGFCGNQVMNFGEVL